MYKIFITGKISSGKDTFGKLIRSELSKANNISKTKIKMISFADPIKNMAEIAFPYVAKRCFYGPSKFRTTIIKQAFKNGIPLTVRQVLLDLGNDFGRKYNSELWINNLNHRFHNLVIKNVDGVIVTDCRFINEFNHLKSLGFQSIKLLRDSDIKINDESEIQQDLILDNEYDFIVNNNGSLQDLKLEAQKIIQNLYK